MQGSIYIHIPYCRNKCIYCDFYSGGARIADWPRLRNALMEELRLRVEELPEEICSVYIGGGTPSLIPAGELHLLMQEMRRILAAAGRRLTPDCEMTLEANPEDVDKSAVAAWKECGFNRISLGVQSFNDKLLSAIGRRHTGFEAAESARLLLEEFDNVSIDLIFGLPGQSLPMLKADLRRIEELRPQHVSVYSLMYEEGTALTRLRDIGKITEAAESLTSEMFKEISSKLRNFGYSRYEISNYSLPGYESRHNSGYWTGRPYLGLGPAAHSYDGAMTRRANPADLKGYLKHFCENTTANPLRPFYTEEQLSRDELREERIMLSLRRREGIDLEAYARTFGESEYHRLLKASVPQLHRGFLELTPGVTNHSEDFNSLTYTKDSGIEASGTKDSGAPHLRLTPEGIMLADTIIISLL